MVFRLEYIPAMNLSALPGVVDGNSTTITTLNEDATANEPTSKETLMAQLKQFVVETTSDLRGGHNSWRVLGMLWSAALLITVITATIRF